MTKDRSLRPDARLVRLHAERGDPQARLGMALAALEQADWGLLLSGEVALARQLAALLGPGTLRVDGRLHVGRAALAEAGLAVADLHGDLGGARAVWLLEPDRAAFDRARRAGVRVIVDGTLAPGGGWPAQGADYVVYRDAVTLTGYAETPLAALFGQGEAPAPAAPPPSELAVALALRDVATLPLRLARFGRTVAHLTERLGASVRQAGPTALLLAPDAAPNTLAPLGGILAAARHVPDGLLLTPGLEDTEQVLGLLRGENPLTGAHSGREETRDEYRNEGQHRNEGQQDEPERDGPQRGEPQRDNRFREGRLREGRPREDRFRPERVRGDWNREVPARRDRFRSQPDRPLDRRDREPELPSRPESGRPESSRAENLRPDSISRAEQGGELSRFTFEAPTFEGPTFEAAETAQARTPAAPPAEARPAPATEADFGDAPLWEPEIVYSNLERAPVPLTHTVNSGPDAAPLTLVPPLAEAEPAEPEPTEPEPAVASVSEPTVPLTPDLPSVPTTDADGPAADLTEEQAAIYARLRDWRNAEAKRQEISRFIVASNAALAEIARRVPYTLDDLAAVRGMGPARLSKYGEKILDVVRG